MKRNVKIRDNLDDNQIVVINDIIFKGKRSINWKEVQEYLKSYIGDFYTITDTNETIYIGKDFPDEYTGSKYTRGLKGGYAKAKANVAQAIPEIIQIAANKRYKVNLETKHNMDAKFGWYRYDSWFMLPVFNEQDSIIKYNNYYAEVLIRHDANGKRYLYDILNIKKRNEQPA